MAENLCPRGTAHYEIVPVLKSLYHEHLPARTSSFSVVLWKYKTGQSTMGQETQLYRKALKHPVKYRWIAKR